jgi:sugar/nucleoside kinase (ribokinase family)
VRPIALVGSLSSDRVSGEPPRAGGMPTWAARALRALGSGAWVTAKCAPGDRAALLRPLVATGLPVDWRPAAATTAFSFSYDGDRRTMTVDAVGDPWAPEEVTGVRAQWVHVGPLLRSDFDAPTLAALAKGGRRVSLDGQGLVRAPQEGPLVLDRAHDPELLRHVTVLKLAEDEAEALLGDVTRTSLASLGVPEVLVTRGSRGSAVLAGGELTEVPARAVDADPTGAGDSFAAAYVASRAAGYAPVAAARRATALVGALLAGRRR